MSDLYDGESNSLGRAFGRRQGQRMGGSFGRRPRLGDVASDAAAAFKEVDEDTANVNAGQQPFAAPAPTAAPSAAAPVRPQPQPQFEAPAAQPSAPAPAAGSATNVQQPIRDDSGFIVGYQVLDSAGNIVDQYAVDEQGNRITTAAPPPDTGIEAAEIRGQVDEHVGLKVTIGVGAGFGLGLLTGWLWNNRRKSNPKPSRGRRR